MQTAKRSTPSTETRIGLLEIEHAHSVVEEEDHISKIKKKHGPWRDRLFHHRSIWGSRVARLALVLDILLKRTVNWQ